MKYMFVCAQGAIRSPTAASVAENLAGEKDLDIDVNYCGIELVKHFQTRFCGDGLKGYDKYFAMEKSIVSDLVSLGVLEEKIVCLNVEDIYSKNDFSLRKIMEDKLREYI